MMVGGEVMGSMKTPRSALVGTQLQAEDPLQVPHEDAEIRGFPPPNSSQRQPVGATIAI